MLVCGTSTSHDKKALTSEQRLQRVLLCMLDEHDLRQLYKLWYTKAGGRQEEKALVDTFIETAPTDLLKYIDNRFQSIVRQAFKLEEEEEDCALLSACYAAIEARKKFDPQEFINLQRILAEGSSSEAHDKTLFRDKAGLELLRERAAAGQYDALCGPVNHVVPILVKDLAAKVPA